MAVPGISPYVVHQVIANQVNPAAATNGLSSDDLMVIGLLSYMVKLHEVVLDSWSRFRENQKDMRERKESTNRRQQIDAQLLEGQLKEFESRKDSINVNKPYLDSTTRHLNSQV